MTQAEDIPTSQNIYILQQNQQSIRLSIRLFENPDHKDSKIKNYHKIWYLCYYCMQIKVVLKYTHAPFRI